MKLTVGKHSIDLSRPVVMTIINATPDSFYEGSRTPPGRRCRAQGGTAVADGAAILDVGGYSSRPGADNVTPDEELRRVTLALETIRRRCPDTPVSIDTFRSEVAEGAIERFGPCIVNDITAGTADPAIAAVAARHGVPLIAMHMRGTPQTMQTMTRYDDLTGEVLAYFCRKDGWLRGEGVTQIVLDRASAFRKPWSRTSACWAKCTGWANWAIRFWPAYPASR